MKTTPIILLCLLSATPVSAETLTLPPGQRPAWLQQEGIVMAGSWEPLLFRVRRDAGQGYTPSAQQRADYQREHRPEMVARLKQLGVNFVMMHCYKGAGMDAERDSMADAVRFARLCHQQGLHVGVYVYSGALLWELFFPEVPNAKDWTLLDEKGEPLMYAGGRAAYRYYWNRNHPDAQAFYRRIVRYAVEKIRTDLVHFDNYTWGPGYDENSVHRFREYLRREFSPAQRSEMGIRQVAAVTPPVGRAATMLRFAWDDFRCQSLADSYLDMSRFARSIRGDVLIECNPGGVGTRIRPPVDHGRLLQGGEAFWDEGARPGYRQGKLVSHIRTYKVARRASNMAFCYTTTPLEMAESMAFNDGCLGAVCWFEYGELRRRPGSDEPVSPELEPYIRFFRNRGDLLRGARVVADIAVLRSFPSQVFADPSCARQTARVENALIESRDCFQIIYDHQLERLQDYPVLVLAGCVAMSDQQIDQIKAYVHSGGRLCMVGPAASHDQWMRRRPKPALADLPDAAVVRVDPSGDLLAAIHHAGGDARTLVVQGPPGLCAELTEQDERRLLHLVNYHSDKPAMDISTRLRLPDGCQVTAVRLVSPERTSDLTLPFQQKPGAVTFRIPRIDVYEIAVVSFRKKGTYKSDAGTFSRKWSNASYHPVIATEFSHP